MKLIVPTSNATATAANFLLLSLADASPIVGLTVWQLRGLIANGELPVVRVGRKLYLRRAALVLWAERAEERYRS